MPEREFAVLPGVDDNVRLDVFLAERIPDLTRARIQKLIESGEILVGGLHRKAGYRVRAGDRVTAVYEAAAEAPERLEPLDIPLRILHADADVIVLDKPSGLVVHPGAGHLSDTLVNALVFHFPDLAAVGPPDRPGIVHRLDGETSGVMVVARSLAAYDDLRLQFRNREVKKTYLGLVHGRMKPKAGEITWALGRHPVEGSRMSIHTRRPRVAMTEYRVLREYRDTSLLEIQPLTGRTHQIRVHMATSGHPLVGDKLYGPKPEKDGPRLFLHAHRLVFRHPGTGAKLLFRSPLPPELRRHLRAQQPPRPRPEDEELAPPRRFRG